MGFQPGFPSRRGRDSTVQAGAAESCASRALPSLGELDHLFVERAFLADRFAYMIHRCEKARMPVLQLEIDLGGLRGAIACSC